MHTMTEATPQTRTVDEFVAALGALDFARLGATLSETVRFRALVPPGFREADGRGATVDMIAGWFGDAMPGSILRRAAGVVGDRVWAAYRIRVDDDGESSVAEQRVLAVLDGDAIATLDFMCSGFHSAS
jgi:hypothetical protein